MVLFNSKTQILFIIFVKLVWAQMEGEETKGHLKQSFVSLLKNIVDVNEKRMLAMKKLNNLQDFILTKNTLTKLHGLDVEEGYSSEAISDQNSMLNLVDMKNTLNLSFRRTYSRKQEATNSNINIFIPVNSFNIKSDYINDESIKIGNRNDHNINTEDENNDNDDKNNKNNKLDKVKYINYNIESRNKENVETYDDSIKMYDLNGNNGIFYNTNKDNDPIDIRNEYDQIDKEIDNGIVFRKNWRDSCSKKTAKACRSACVDAHKNGCMLYKCSRRAKKAFSKECKRSCRNKFLSGQYSDGDSDWE